MAAAKKGEFGESWEYNVKALVLLLMEWNQTTLEYRNTK